MCPRGSLGLAHPQPLPPAPSSGSPLLPRPSCDLTWEPLSLDPLRCLGLGFPAWLWGCLRPGHVFLLKWGSCRGRLFPCRAGGPSDLGELLFRHRMVKDSPRASCLWDLHPPHSALCLQEGQCRPWAVPVSAAASSRACRDEAGRSLAHLAPGPRPGGLRAELSSAAVLKSAASWRRRREAAISSLPSHVPCSCEQACGQAQGSSVSSCTWLPGVGLVLC